MDKLTVPLLSLLFLSVIFVGCSEFVPSTHDVTLVNKTNHTLVYQAFNTTNTNINPQPFKIDQEEDHLVEAGEEVSLESEIGVLASHEDLKVFVWEVRGDSAFISQSLTYSADKVKQKKYAIEVETFDSMCTDGSGSQEPGEGLFEHISNPELSEEQLQYYSSVWNRLYTAEVAVIRLADNIESLLQERESFLLPLSHGESFTLNAESVKRNESGSISWSGEFQNIPGGSVTLVYGEGLTGTIKPSVDPNCQALVYKLSPLGRGLNTLIRLNTDTGIYLED